MKRLMLMTVLAVVLCTSVAMAANDVTVPSQTVAAGSRATVGVLLTNDINARQVVVPLVFREVCGGSFIDSLALSFGDRINAPGVMVELRVRNQYAVENGTCKADQPGGFGTLTFNDASDGVIHPVTASPWGALASAAKLFSSSLLPGADATGSVVLTMRVNGLEGQFEIDSTCTNPANHVLYVQDVTPPVGVTPTFSKGLITVGAGCGPSNQVPVAVCHDTTIVASGSCDADAVAAAVDGGSFDPDGDPITLELVPAGPYAMGANPVQLIVTDDSGAADTCNATITVVDLSPPLLTCPADDTVSNDTDECGAIVNYTGYSASDDCSGVSAFFTPADGSLFPIGTTRVKMRAVDGAGNEDSCFFNVTVTDDQAPVATCPDSIVVDNDPGQCGAIVNFAIGTSDNCGVVNVDTTWSSGSFFDIGVTEVEVIVSDAAGNADTCRFDVTVNDVEPPVASCAGTLVVDAETDLCGATVSWTPSASDNCPGVNVVANPAPGSFFPVGNTQVEVIATDASGNADTCYFGVEVNDTQAPVLTGNGTYDMNPNVDQCETAASFPVDWYTATDNCGPVTVTYNPPRGSIVPVGITQFEVIATDGSGNADTAYFDVSVVDNQPPVAICHADTGVLVGPLDTEAVVTFNSSATDNCPGATIACTPASGSTFPLGGTLVTCIATDAAGNADTCTFTVTVTSEQLPPVALCQDIQLVADANCEADGSVNNGSNDPDGGGVTLSQDPAGPYPLGQTLVTLLVTDDEGDTASCQATVTVVDETLPTIICNMEFAGTAADENCEHTLIDYTQDGAYSADDNCGAPTITQKPAPGTIIGLGPQTIWLIAEDGSGNKDSCSFELTVRDQTPPAIECPLIVVPWEVGNDPGQCGAIVEWNAGLATATDNCGANLWYEPASGSFFEVGPHVIAAIAEDGAGNADTCYIDLTVVDSEAPAATCPGNLEETVQFPVDTATINWVATVTDNCPGATIVCVPPSGSVFGLGTTPVMCIATDGTGNADTCGFTVTLNQVSGCEGAMLVALPDTLCFYANECDTEQQCDSIFIDTDTPGCDLPWTAEASEPWIVSITPNQGVTPGGAIVCVDPTLVPGPGYYTDSIEIYRGPFDAKGILPDAYVRVHLTVNEVIPVLGLSDASFIFGATTCGPLPATQSFDVFNANPDACNGLDWVATEDAAWMSINPPSGTSPSTVVITVDQTGLLPGIYADTITVTSAGAIGSPAYVIVEFGVTGCIEQNASYTVGDVCGSVGDTVPVEVNFCNNFLATGMSLGLAYNTSQIRVVGADFTGSRVEYLGGSLVATLDDVAGTICLAALVFPQQQMIDTGCGLFTTLYFEILNDEGCPGEVVIPIDSMTIGEGCTALFTNADLEPVWPTFDMGSVCVDCGCPLCGAVVDGNDDPVGPALVQLWDSYPDGSVLASITTDGSGHFCFDGLESGVLYDLRIIVPGYCPLIVADIGCTYDAIPLFEMSPLPDVPTQPHAADWWSTNATIQGVPIMPGDVITAMDPDGVICGIDVVENPGEYLVLVVADDPLTPGFDEGAEAGDVITLYLNCECPLVAQGSWQPFGSTEFDPNFDCTRKPIEIPLCDTWTLISFNVLPDDPSVDSVLFSIDGLYMHLLSATCADGNISWEQGRPINDLLTMDPWHGYWVKPIGPGVGPIVIDGAPLDADLPLNLCTGWNAMSYLPTVPDELPHALASIDGQYEHVFTAECDGIRSWDRNRPALLNDLICMKQGYGYWIKMDNAATQTYPVAGYSCSEAGLSKPVNILDRVTVTPRYADFWSADETGLYPGDRITVRTTGGVICGEALAGSKGMFMVHVYGDDPTTEAVEGATEGTELVFEVNGEIASLASGSPIWNERGSREVRVQSAGASPLPTEFALLQNYPNPFNPSTTIAFRMPEASDVTLTVYNVLGQPVRTVFSGYMDAGSHTVEWDGRTNNGETVQSGIYFYRLQTPNWSDAKKMTLLK